MTTNLTLTHLRFDVVARTAIKLGEHRAGDRLRNALANVMLRAVCPETRRAERPAPEHAAVCPACWLLAADLDPGRVRRAYALVPPQPPLDVVEAGERFSFVITLFGEGLKFLPYFVLAVPEMGRGGVGPGRGQFELETIWAGDPLTGRCEPVLRPGEAMVHTPQAGVDWNSVQAGCAGLDNKTLCLRFLTPTRLIESEALVKTPDFGVLFRRVLHRIDQLGQQFAGEARRPYTEIEHLHAAADRVRLVDADTRWLDFKSWSGRRRQDTWMSGFVGTATYRGQEWGALLPWLVLGQGAQVGKLAVKGNGVFEIDMWGRQRYWEWMMASDQLSVINER